MGTGLNFSKRGSTNRDDVFMATRQDRRRCPNFKVRLGVFLVLGQLTRRRFIIINVKDEGDTSVPSFFPIKK